MSPTLDQALRDWRDFYMLSGTAAATLVGLMFVAASIGSSLFNRRGVAPMHAFVTPTVVHFAATLFVCMISVMPGYSALSLGGVIGLGAFAGLAYCASVIGVIVRRFAVGLDWEDRAFYALLPVSGYLLLLGSSRAGVRRAAERSQLGGGDRRPRSLRRRLAQRLGHDGVDNHPAARRRASRGRGQLAGRPIPRRGRFALQASGTIERAR